MAEMSEATTLTAEKAQRAQEVLLQQEHLLRYEESFGADEAFDLGRIAVSLLGEFPAGYSVTITREADGVRAFQWVADTCDNRNLLFADGKRKAALRAGHASPWAQLAATVEGDVSTVWAQVPEEVPACGAFPLRVGEQWVATIAVSGLDAGLDHEVIIRSLEQALGVSVPHWDAPVA